MKYDHKKIEKKWQAQWEKDGIYATPDMANGKENSYILVEFPYPSGNLHVGHWYAFAVPDMYARYLRMRGKNVLYPIGFDAFGLPAENAAIKNKLNPRTWTYGNIDYMKKQLASMGASFDWSRELATCDPEYYKWTQWQFLQFFKNDLAYRKETAVNWCPKDKTVLANEQVVDGRCERCGEEVVQKQMLQWNLRITKYADRLAEDLESLEWPQQIKESQRNWIGRSEGAEIDFFLDFGDPEINERVDSSGMRAHIKVFTTRPDTLYGATYLVLAPEHPWVTLALRHETVLKNTATVQAYVDASARKTELERQTEQKEKTGVLLEGVSAINPATGEKIPLYVADYVLGNYGTGAIMAVPAHDERDYDFAKKFGLEIRQVVMPVFGAGDKRPDAVHRQTVSAIVRNKAGKVLVLRWPEYKWLTGVIGGINEGETPEQAAEREVLEETGYRARAIRAIPIAIESHFYAEHKKEWRSRIDTPVLLELLDETSEAISDEEAEKHAAEWLEPDQALTGGMFGNNKLAMELALGRVSAYAAARHSEEQRLVNSGDYTGREVSEAKNMMAEAFGRKKTTYKLRDWIVSRQRYWGVPIPIVHCEKCGPVAVPDAQLPVILPEIEDYLPTGDGKSPIAKARDWVEVRCPECGGKGERETDTLDTFVDSSWYFLRYADPKNESDFSTSAAQKTWMPVDMYFGGAEHTTMHLLYSRFWQKALYDLGLVNDAEPYKRRINRSLILGPDGQKMSKSRGNVIDPDEAVERLGADTVRMYLAFIGPYNEVSSYPWNPDGVVGVRRFLERISSLSENVQENEVPELETPLHKTIRKVGNDISLLKFNTAISQMMILLNAAEKIGAIGKSQWLIFLRLLAPFAPHLAEELWRSAGNALSVHLENWPDYDESKLQEDMVTIAVQIDGKTRSQVSVPSDASKADVESAARGAVAERLTGVDIERTVVVPGRLVNFVIRKSS